MLGQEDAARRDAMTEADPGSAFDPTLLDGSGFCAPDP
jgi:hypothetical protein